MRTALANSAVGPGTSVPPAYSACAESKALAVGLARIMVKQSAVSSDPRDRRRHEHSFVDVLERVGDGIHVDIVAREPKRRRPAKEHSEKSPPEESKPSTANDAVNSRKRTSSKH